MGTDAFVPVAERFDVLELDADPFSVDVETIIGSVLCGDVADDDVGTGDGDGADAFFGRQNNAGFSGCFARWPAEVERSFFSETGLSGFQLFGGKIAPRFSFGSSGFRFEVARDGDGLFVDE